MISNTIKLRIESLAAGGDGLGHHQGKVCFVPNTAPQDLVAAQVVRTTKGFLRAVVTEVLEAGPGRREPPCPLFGRCGGCGWLHLDEAVQRQAKKEVLARALGLPSVELLHGETTLGYRRLARLHSQSAGRRLGFMADQGDEVIDTPACPVLCASLSGILPALGPGLLWTLGQPAEVRLSAGQGQVALAIECTKNASAELYTAALTFVPTPLETVVLTAAGHTAVVAGPGSIRAIAADGQPFSLPAGSFGQANEEVNALLGSSVNEILAGRKLRSGLELFAGAGNLTPIIAAHVKRLDMVELDPRAAAAARDNLRSRGLTHVGVHQADAFDALRKLGKERDLVVLDPPRVGALEVCEALAQYRPRCILYVSCDPATLARDLGPLRQAGYRVVHGVGFDMFPQTPHLEAVVLLER